MALFKVFLSSPFRGLMDKRRLIHEAVKKACSAVGIVRMESRPPTDELSAKACLNELRKCDIYLGLIGSTYGTIIPREQLDDAEGSNAYKYYGLSYTHYEFKKAGELRLPIVVFLQAVEDESRLPPKFKEFRSEIQRNVTPYYFEEDCLQEDSLQELTCQVVESLRERVPEWICEAKLRLPGFYGRLGILGELYGLLTDERMLNNTLCIHGVGGIGKSALAEALMLLLSLRGYKIIKFRSIGGREARLFPSPPDYVNKSYKPEDLNPGVLAELLGLKPGSDPVSTILDYLDRDKIVLFIDDYQEVEERLEELVNEAHNRLRVARLIAASRVRAKGEYSLFRLLGGLIDKEAEAKIRDEMGRKDVEPSEDNLRLVYERTRGHPLAIEMFVALMARRVLSPKELARLGAIRDVRDEGEVRDFISRILVENVDEKDLKLLEYLSVFRGGFDLNMVRTVMKGLGDDRASREDKELESGLIKPLMRSNIIEPAKGAFPYNFTHGMVREAAYSRLEDLVKAHKFAIETYRDLKPSFINDAETVYHAEQLLRLEKEEEAKRGHRETILECSGRLSAAAYQGGLARLAVEYGIKAFTAALTLRKPIDALAAAEIALMYAASAQLPRSRAEELHGALEKLYHEALKLDEDTARLGYAYALRSWATYALNALGDVEGAEKALKEALEAVGSPEDRHIKDSLGWYEGYGAVLEVKADAVMRRGRYGEAQELLQGLRELLEEYKESLKAKCGEEGYFEDLAVLESKLGELAFREAKFQNARDHFTEDLEASAKAQQNDNSASARLNLAKVGLLLAQDMGDFAQAAEGEVMDWNLGKAIKFFEGSGDKDGEAKAGFYVALALLAQGIDSEALEQARRARAKAWEGVGEYAKAVCALCLAYVKLTQNLEEFRKEGALVKEVTGLTIYAVKAMEKLGSTSFYLGSFLLALEGYLLGRLTWEGLLDLAMRVRKHLEEAGDKSGVQILGWAEEALREEGNVTERLLRTKLVKLIVAL